MEHKYYSQCNLLIVHSENGDRLFKIKQQNGRNRLNQVSFIKRTQKFIKVYPEYNLIITPKYLFTLRGKIVEEGVFISVEIAPCEQNFLLIFKNSSQDNIEGIWIWNKKQIIWRQHSEKMLYTDKYIAVLKDELWNVYDSRGNLLNENYRPSSAVKIKGDFLISDTVGCHDVYSLKTGKFIMQNQQLVQVSSRTDFAIGLNLQRIATIWRDGKLTKLNDISFVDIVDEAGLFLIKYQNYTSFIVFSYLDLIPELFGKTSCVIAEFVSYDKKIKQLVIHTDKGIFFYKKDKDSFVYCPIKTNLR